MRRRTAFAARAAGAAALLLLAGAARAQLAPDSARLVAKLALTPLISHAYEGQAEYRWARRFSFTLAPQVVAGPVPFGVSPQANAAGDRVNGYGAGLGLRCYLPNSGTEGTGLAGLYVGLRADYQHLRLAYQQDAWGEDAAPDGLRYYTYRPRDFGETIVRVGAAATLGYQCQVFHPRLRLDASASRHLLRSRPEAGEASRYRTSPADYGASGAFWSLGLGLGWVLRQGKAVGQPL